MNILAVDQGTSATKALVVAPGGRVLGEASAPVHPRAGAGGAVEQDPVRRLAAPASSRVTLTARRSWGSSGRPVMSVAS